MKEEMSFLFIQFLQWESVGEMVLYWRSGLIYETLAQAQKLLWILPVVL